MNINSLDRFIEAQKQIYEIALKEMKNGKKQTHWMWYVFPQLRGLGKSNISYIYGINGIDEAKEYLSHPLLSKRLVEISIAMLEHKGKAAHEILGNIDCMKLHSSMTLFAYISEQDSVFHQVLDCFYNKELDEQTLKLINKEKSTLD